MNDTKFRPDPTRVVRDALKLATDDELHALFDPVVDMAAEHDDTFTVHTTVVPAAVGRGSVVDAFTDFKTTPTRATPAANAEHVSFVVHPDDATGTHPTRTIRNRVRNALTPATTTFAGP